MTNHHIVRLTARAVVVAIALAAVGAPSTSPPDKVGVEHHASASAPTPPAIAAKPSVTRMPVQAAHVDQTPRVEAHRDYTSSEWWLVYLTAALALYTALLYRATVRLGKDAKEENQRQAKDMQESLRIAEQSVEESRRLLVLTQRPRLRARNFVLTKSIEDSDYYLTGQLYVSNIGGMPAHITESHCVVYVGDTLPMRRPYEGANGNNGVTVTTIEAGSSTVGFFHADVRTDTGLVSYVMGWVEYQDDLAIKRRLAFCRELVFENGGLRFRPVDNLDYEHEE